MRRFPLFLIVLLVSVASADPMYNGLCDHKDMVDDLPKLIGQVDSFASEVMKLQDKIVGIAEGQGLPIPIPRIATSAAGLALMPITEPVRLAKEFAEGITDANMQLLKASADQVKWAVDQQVQLFRMANDSLLVATQYLTDVNEAILEAATEPLRQLQDQLNDAVDTLTDIVESNMPSMETVTDAVEDLMDEIFGGGLW
jgi:methyl-accepting chemotaxis protein